MSAELHHRVTIELGPTTLSFLRLIIHHQQEIMANLTALTEAVNAQGVLVNTVITILGAPATDQPAVDALTQQVVDQNARLTAALPPTP